MDIEGFVNRLEGVRPYGSGFMAKCPGHVDKRASLKVDRGENGGIVIKCFAGCDNERIVETMGLNLSDLMPPKPDWRPEPYQRERIVKTYDYRDENGVLLYQSVRFEPKTFKPRLPNGAYGLPRDVRRVPYRLPEIIRAVDAGATVLFVVEGEKDADRLWSVGFPATSNQGGAKKWGESETQALAFLPETVQVIVLSDNDMAGAEHAAIVSFQLKRIGKSVRVVELPGLPEKGDVSDWLNAGQSVEELRATCRLDGPQVIDMPVVAEELPASGPFHLTDQGNAERLVAEHGRDLRYVHAWGKWLVWDGKRWRKDTTGEVYRRAMQTVQAMWREAEELADSEARKALRKWADKSESEARINSMVSLAEKLRGVSVTPDDMDSDPWLLNVQNGTLDLRTGKLLPHDRKRLITRLLPTDYQEGASCPTWQGFLERIMGGNKDLVAYLQQAVGYSLTGDTSEQCMFFLYGTGKNGKSTFLDTLRWLLADYAIQANPDTFLAQNTQGARPDVAKLNGTRFVTANEIDEGKRLSEGLVKQLTGGDRITARFLYQDEFEFSPTFKIFMAGNHKPVVRGVDEGIWRRLRLIPFEVLIPEEERDPNLKDKLKAEAAGILAWAVVGCATWQTFGLGAPDAVQTATAQYREEMDVLGEFISEECHIAKTVQVKVSELFQAWKRWCEENGEYPGTARTLGLKMQERGYKSERRTGGQRWYPGITLKVT